jgi:hypothetical protein
MKNLILSVACGLDPENIEFFFKSLRKFYLDDIFFLVGKKDHKIKKMLEKYNSEFIEINENKYDVQLKRYYYYLNILNKKKYKNILVCDSRDIYFQSNPFNYRYKGDINFFLEDQKIKKCAYNSNWLIKAYGNEVFEKLSEKIISCSGTTLGTYEGMKSYLTLMIDCSRKYKYKKKLKYFLTFRRDKEGRGVDQAHANFIAHNKLIKNSYFYQNSNGPVATVYHLKNITFNNNSELMNSINEPYAIVHQYDKRWSEFSSYVSKFKEKL